MGEALTDILYTPDERDRMARLVFSLILCSLIGSFFANTLVHQLHQPVVKYPYADPTYWAMHFLQIPETIAGNEVVAWLFDIALVGSCALALRYPRRRWLIAAFVILLFIYFITYNTFGTHHTGNKMGILFIAIPFIAADIRSFNFLWQGLRYFILFGYSCAATWKLVRLSWLHANQGILILQKNIAGYLYFNPNTWLADMYHRVLQYPALLQCLYITGIILEAVFVIGFFTKKADRFLFVTSIVLVIGFWFMADAYFFELLILSMPLLNYKQLLLLQRRKAAGKKGSPTPA
jgi:hypothetical protein